MVDNDKQTRGLEVFSGVISSVSITIMLLTFNIVTAFGLVKVLKEVDYLTGILLILGIVIIAYLLNKVAVNYLLKDAVMMIKRKK